MPKKTWTKEEFIEEARKMVDSPEPYLLEKQERRRQWLRKKRNQKGKRHAKSKLQRT
jgi:hypothetical protein